MFGNGVVVYLGGGLMGVLGVVGWGWGCMLIVCVVVEGMVGVGVGVVV